MMGDRLQGLGVHSSLGLERLLDIGIVGGDCSEDFKGFSAFYGSEVALYCWFFELLKSGSEGEEMLFWNVLFFFLNISNHRKYNNQEGKNSDWYCSVKEGIKGIRVYK